MILDDKVTLERVVYTGEYDAHGVEVHYLQTDRDLPAHVGSASGTSPFDPGREVNITDVRCLLPPIDLASDPNDITVTWRGNDYGVTAMLPVHRHGRLHHWSLNLERVQG